MANFNDIVGQEQLKTQLIKAVETGNVSHAYLISGEIRSGKEFIAKIFANALMCTGEGEKPCGECRACKMAKDFNHPDIRFITHEKPNSIGVDDIREQIIDDIVIKPSVGPYKIYICNEAEKMTPQAQNALLKTLEEPPEYGVIILLTTSEEAMLQTVLSRCLKLSMHPVKDEELKNFLMKELKVPDYKADISVAFSRGNLGKAKMLVSSEDFDKIKDEAIILLKYIDEMDLNDMIIAVNKIKEYRFDIDDYLDIISVWYRDVLLFKATGDANGLIFKGEIQYIKKVAKKSSYEGIEKILDALKKAQSRLSANVDFNLTMELLLMAIKEN